jgi:plasmid stabilization system protein ParE
MDFKLIWSQESINNLEEILDYLITNWSQKEVTRFKKKLARQIDLIIQFPKMFPVSIYNAELRKAVLSKQTTLFYKIKGNEIYLVYIFVNARNIKKIKQSK